MTLDEILPSLFPRGHDIDVDNRGLVFGAGRMSDGGQAHVVGVANKTPLGIDEAAELAGRVIAIIEKGGSEPLIVLVDSDSQRMSKRDELLGLSEYLAHLAKCLVLADRHGHHTIGLLYGHTAAGAFIATALATRTLVALPGAEPQVMDLPSMARVTKLSLDVLQEKAKTTPVFAPGLDNLAQTGAVHETWDPNQSLADQLAALLAKDKPAGDMLAGDMLAGDMLAKDMLAKDMLAEDTRDGLGKARGGRPRAADIAARVVALAASAP